MTVFIVNSSKEVQHDVSAAERFGAVHHINHKYLFGDEIGDDGGMPSEFMAKMRACADKFDPAADYLAIVGDHLQLVAFTAELAYRYGWFNVLRWDRNERAYFPVRIHTSRCARSST